MTASTTSAIICRETSYITPKGLGFSLYCNKDQTNIGDIDNAGAGNVEDCVSQCSTHPAQLCGAAAFDSTTFKCFFKNASVTANGAVTRNGWILGIANETQLQSVPETCSNNGQTQTTQNGLGFTIYCDQTVSGYDLCPDSAPDCRAHTNTFDECLEFCSTTHPLCTGVVWEPTLRAGYQNCYPKNTSAHVFDNVRSSNSIGIRSGKALLEPANDDCYAHANATIAASNKEIFGLSCEEGHTGNNITVQHVASLSNCIDSCTNYTKSLCFGAVFDANMVDGFENCYLKSTIGGSIPGQAGFTFAKRQDAGNNSIPDNPSPGQTDGGSKAWIAGPVIATIVFIIAALWWWRRKSRSKETRDVQNTLGPEPWIKAELDPTTLYTPTFELALQPQIQGIHEIGPGHPGARLQ